MGRNERLRNKLKLRLGNIFPVTKMTRYESIIEIIIRVVEECDVEELVRSHGYLDETQIPKGFTEGPIRSSNTSNSPE